MTRGIVSRRMRLSKARVLATWRAFSSRETQRCSKMQEISQRRRSRTLGAHFRVWRERGTERRRRELVTGRAVAHFAKRELRTSMRRWAAAAEETRRGAVAHEEQQRAARHLRFTETNCRERDDLVRERRAFAAHVEDTERERIRLFHAQLAQQQAAAADTAEAAMARAVSDAEAIAASLEAEARELRENKPTGGGSQCKRTPRASTVSRAAQQEQQAVTSEVAARIEGLRVAFATACETADNRLRRDYPEQQKDASGPDGAAAASTAVTLCTSQGTPGSHTVASTPPAREAAPPAAAAALTSRVHVEGYCMGEQIQAADISGGGGGENGGGFSVGGGDGEDGGTGPSPVSPPLRVLPTELEAKLARAEAVVMSAAARMTSAAAAAATAQANFSARAQSQDWEARVAAAEKAAVKAASMAREASCAARESKRGFLSLQLRQQEHEAAASAAISRGELVLTEDSEHTTQDVGCRGVGLGPRA